MGRLRPAGLALLVALLVGAAPAVGQASPYDETFLRAERTERALGDLDVALRLYSDAAALAGENADRRVRAEVRAAACLRRLGRTAEARKLLEPWEKGTLAIDHALRSLVARELARLDASGASAGPDVPVPVSADTELQLRTLREENERLQGRLERALAQIDSVDRTEMDRLIAELRERERQIAELRAAQRAASPESDAEAMEYTRTVRRGRARLFVQVARVKYREGRFDDARAFLLDALATDPDNVDAQALLSRISAPLGDRERLYQEILEAVALAHQVRRGRWAAEVRGLLDEGRRRVAADDPQGAIEPLERALALVGVAADALDQPEELRSEIRGLLRRAQSAGAERHPVEAPPLDDLQAAWLDGLRRLLEHAGDEVANGLVLRFHDLDRPLAVAAAGLPPVGERPSGFELATDRVPPADLLVAYLAAEHHDLVRRPGHEIRAVGQTAVVRAPAEVQQALHERLAALTITPGDALELTVAARRSVPGAWDAALGRLGVPVEALPSGGRRAVLSARHAQALADGLLNASSSRFADARLTGAPLRAFRLDATTGSRARLAVRVLPVSGDRPGVGLRAEVVHTPTGRDDGAALHQSVTSGALLGPGEVLVLFGLADPQDPSRDLAVIVGRPGDPAAVAAGDGPAPAPEDPRVRPASAGEYLLPSTVAGLLEVARPALEIDGRPPPTRRDGLRARLADAARLASVLEVRPDRIVVSGPAPAHQAVKDLLARLGTARIEPLTVASHAVDERGERRLLEAVPTFRPADGVVWAELRTPEELRTVEALLRASARGTDGPTARLSPPPTGRREVSFVRRTSYRRTLEVRDGAVPSVGRSETAWLDHGVVLGIRPFGRRDDGRLDVDLDVRGVWISDLRERILRTELGPVTVQDPVLTPVWGDVRASLSRGGALLLAGLPHPAGGGLRLVLLVRGGE